MAKQKKPAGPAPEVIQGSFARRTLITFNYDVDLDVVAVRTLEDPDNQIERVRSEIKLLKATQVSSADKPSSLAVELSASARDVRIERPFGSLVMRVLALARPTKIETSALAQTIEDTRHEINEALAAGRDEQVRRLKFRGWLLLVWMVILEFASAAAAIRRLIG